MFCKYLYFTYCIRYVIMLLGKASGVSFRARIAQRRFPSESKQAIPWNLPYDTLYTLITEIRLSFPVMVPFFEWFKNLPDLVEMLVLSNTNSLINWTSQLLKMWWVLEATHSDGSSLSLKNNTSTKLDASQVHFDFLKGSSRFLPRWFYETT